jgi:hypothetical protein
MKEQAYKLAFFQQIKERHAPTKTGTVEEDEQVARQRYYEKCVEQREVPMPAFVKIQNKCLFLADFRVTDEMAEALYDFLAAAKESPTQQVRKLLIDDCGMTDK